MNKQKVSIYIDGQNFYQGVVDNFFNEKHCKQKVNFYEIQDGFDLAEFCYHLVQGQDLDLIYYFDGRLNGRLFSSRAIANQKRFFKKLEGYLEVRVELGQIQGNESVKYQKGVDVRLATYLIRDAHRNKYNMAYLLSSDKDFCPAVEYIQGFSNKRVINYVFFKERYTKMLADICRRMRKLENKDIYPFCSDNLLKRLNHFSTLKSAKWYGERSHKGMRGFVIRDAAVMRNSV